MTTKRKPDETEAALQAVQRYLQGLHDRQCEQAADKPGQSEFALGHETAIQFALSYVESCLRLRRMQLGKRRAKKK